MQLLPDMGAQPTSSLSTQSSSPGLPGLSRSSAESGFQGILSRFGFSASTGDAPAGAGKALPLALAPASRRGGEMLPLQRQGMDPAQGTALATALLDKLGGQLEDLTATIERLLEREGHGEGDLSRLLSEELNLGDAEVETVLAALESWVEQPPTLAVGSEQLMAAGPGGLEQVRDLSAVLAGLDEQLSDWLRQLDEPPGSTSTVQAGPDRNPPPLDVRALGDLSDSASLADRQPGRAAMMLARILQNVQNSAATGSLPMSMDMARPEAALMTSQGPEPSRDVAFSAALVTMARQSMNPGQGDGGGRDTPVIPVSPAGFESTEFGFPGGQTQMSEPRAQADLLNLIRVDRPMLAADAGRQLGDRIQLMVRGDIKHATIRLDPPELGMMDVRVTVQNDQTQVQIIVQNPQVREALEGQSARLREFLEQQGLSLAELDIRDGSAREGDDQDDGEGRGERLATGADDGDDGPEGESRTGDDTWQQGLVDQFV